MLKNTSRYYVKSVFIPFSESISLKINVIARQEFKLIYFEATVQLVNHYATMIYYFFLLTIRGAYNKFPDFFHMGTFISSTHMQL